MRMMAGVSSDANRRDNISPNTHILPMRTYCIVGPGKSAMLRQLEQPNTPAAEISWREWAQTPIQICMQGGGSNGGSGDGSDSTDNSSDLRTYTNYPSLVLAELGFTRADQDRPLGEFPESWRARVVLARRLLARNWVVLHHPTRGLDADQAAWVRGEIATRAHTTTIIMVTHDRALGNCSDFVIELGGRRPAYYSGDYENYALSRRQRARPRLKVRLSCGHINASMRLKQCTVTFGACSPLAGIDLDLGPGARVAIMGHGKTTLLRVLAGVLEPTSGERVTNCLVGYYEDVGSVNPRANNPTPGQVARDRLSTALSRRICALDNPTRHLSCDEVDSLISALKTYNGIVVIGTNDADLVRRGEFTVLRLVAGKLIPDIIHSDSTLRGLASGDGPCA